MLKVRNSFTRDDGTPLNYTLVNIKDWCKNTFEVVNQLRINNRHCPISKHARVFCDHQQLDAQPEHHRISRTLGEAVQSRF